MTMEKIIYSFKTLSKHLTQAFRKLRQNPNIDDSREVMASRVSILVMDII